MDALDNGDSEKAARGASRVYSSVDGACHFVVVSLSCPCKCRCRHKDHEKQRDGSPSTCIGLGLRSSKGTTSSREAKSLSLSRIGGKGGRSQGFGLQHSRAMFQSSIILEGVSFGISGRVPLDTASGICHGCLTPSKGFLPDRT